MSLRPGQPWLALTRRKYLTQDAVEHLQNAGKQVFAWRRGAITAASTGNWRRARVRSVQAKETWTLWAYAQMPNAAVSQLKDTLQAVHLSREGEVPLDSSCPSFWEARLGPAGSSLNHAGVVVATDGSVKDDGRSCVCSPRQ